MTQEQTQSVMNTKKVNNKFGVFSAFIGLLISFFNIVIQFLLFYWILNAYGSAVNGFIRMSMSLSIIGGTAEGALGMSIVFLMMKPMREGDWISANEIYSTAKRKYSFNLPRNAIFLLALGVLYPLELALVPYLFGDAETPQWTIPVIAPNQENGEIHIFALSGLFLAIGFKQLISSSYYGIYENILQADQRNGLRRIVILVADMIVYSIVFILLNYSINVHYISPPIVFTILLIYPFLRGIMLKMYVLKKYDWLKYQRDFNNFELSRKTSRLFWGNLGHKIISNADLGIIMVALGAFGLKITSTLSLYMVVAVNIQLMLSVLITSFREYYLGIIIREGRLKWDTYSTYELYTYTIAAFSFIMITILTPYVATGFFGETIAAGINNPNVDPSALPEASVYKFIFTSHKFAILFGLSSMFLILIQSQINLIQIKGVGGAIIKPMYIIAGIYLVFATLSILIMTWAWDAYNPHKYTNIILSFYIIKIFTSFIAYIYLYVFTWNKVIFNAQLNNIVKNLMSLITPILIAILIAALLMPSIAPIHSGWNEAQDKYIQDVISVPFVVSSIIVTGVLGFFSILIMPLIFRPEVGLRLLVNLPIVKNIVEIQKNDTKVKRYLGDKITSKTLRENQDVIIQALNKDSSTTLELTSQELEEGFKDQRKPKIYIIKNDIN